MLQHRAGGRPPYAAAPTVAVEGLVPTGSSTQERSIGFVTQAANMTGSAFESTDRQDVIWFLIRMIKTASRKAGANGM